MSSIAPSTSRLVLIPYPSAAVSVRTVVVVRPVYVRKPAPVHWILRARRICRWLEHPIRRTARIVKFAAIVMCFYALVVLVML
jgi:hypothetical protein